MNIQEQITRHLIQHNLTITFMESCTSGLLASMLTDTEGASAIFYGSLVTYSNEEKINAGVNQEIIEKYGVYSSNCSQAMAYVARDRYLTDIAIGVTGTTGNIDPSNPDNAVGELFFSIIVREQCFDFHLQPDISGMSRAKIKILYAQTIYQELQNILSNF